MSVEQRRLVATFRRDLVRFHVGGWSTTATPVAQQLDLRDLLYTAIQQPTPSLPFTSFYTGLVEEALSMSYRLLELGPPTAEAFVFPTSQTHKWAFENIPCLRPATLGYYGHVGYSPRTGVADQPWKFTIAETKINIPTNFLISWCRKGIQFMRSLEEKGIVNRVNKLTFVCNPAETISINPSDPLGECVFWGLPPAVPGRSLSSSSLHLPEYQRTGLAKIMRDVSPENEVLIERPIPIRGGETQ